MPLNLAMAVMSGAEFLLWATLAYLFWKRKLHRRFPAMASYLALHVAASPVFLALLYLQAQPWGRMFYAVYFFCFYGVYIASAILLFLVSMEVFRSALSAFSGLMKFGLVIFRWAVLASVLVTSSTLTYSHRGVLIIPDIAFGLMRSVSILEICLLAFLCFSMNALRLPIRDMAFGIAFGLGLLATNDLVLAAVIKLNSSLTEPFQFILSCRAGCHWHVGRLQCAARARPQADGGAGQLDHLPLERDCLGAWPYRHPGCRGATRQQLLPY